MNQQEGASGTSGVYIRPVKESDLPTFFEYQKQPEANAMAAFPARERETFFDHWNKILSSKSCIAMTVVADERVAGNVGSWAQGDQQLIGYWLGREYWGKGVATQMLQMFLDSFIERPLYAYVAKHNAASIRVLEKCGFIHCEGVSPSLGESDEEIEELVFVLGATSFDGCTDKPNQEL